MAVHSTPRTTTEPMASADGVTVGQPAIANGRNAIDAMIIAQVFRPKPGTSGILRITIFIAYA